MRLHVIPHSTNVDRVALALGRKGLTAERVLHDPGDRGALRALSGQDLVPVLEDDDGTIVVDSMAIVAHLDARHPEPALWPAGAARREVDGFVTWFDHVWKVPPNAIEAALRAPGADPVALARWAARLHASRHELEALLLGRDFLFGDAPGVADLCAAPFLAYAVAAPGPDDHDVFHAVLTSHLDLHGGFPRIAAWLARMARLPRG